MGMVGRTAREAWRLAVVGPPALARERWARWLRPHQSAWFAHVPPAPAQGAAPSAVEAHVLCSHADADMGMWASWSLLRFLPEARLCVHSDGTLTEADIDAWQAVTPGARFIERTEADQRVRDELGPHYPKLAAYRDQHVLAPKLVDVHLLARAPRVLIFDSDILCFRRPVEARWALHAHERRCMWLQDQQYAYAVGPRLLREVLGLSVPFWVNTGFWVAPRADANDWAALDEAVARCDADARCQWPHVWSEQTLAAVFAARQPRGEPLPDGYVVAGGGASSEDVMRHYVNTRSIRPRFFTEGVPRLQRQLAMQGVMSTHAVGA